MRAARIAKRWYQWATEPRLRARLRRVGWHLVPVIAGGAPEGVPGYLRVRVVNPRVANLWAEGFENTLPSGSTAIVLWHSLGTEGGTDNSINYWNQVSGSWSYASHLLTAPASSGTLIVAGNRDWGDCQFRARFRWDTGVIIQVIIHNDATVNNFVAGTLSGTQFRLQKLVAGVGTDVSTSAQTPVNNTFYWIDVYAAGTTYTTNLYNDSAGAIGSQIVSLTGTISDASVQNGYAGFKNAAAVAFNVGGAFNNVCLVNSNNGIQPSFWTPVVTTGEPAFCLSTKNPQSGTYSASIEIVGSVSGNGAWQQTTTLLATPTTVLYQLSSYIKASAGTANVSAGGLTTPNAPTTSTWTQETVSGAMTASPTISCNYSGAVGISYFDTMAVTYQGQEITNDLPHLHQAKFQVQAMIPGNPGSAALGSFTVALHPPGTDQYAAAKATYDLLAKYQRVEFYISHDAANLGKLKYAGIITRVRKSYGTQSVFELGGESDIVLANLSRPFPGELLSNDVDSALIKSYLGTNELGWADNFNPFTSANYSSVGLPGTTAGTWSGTTDDGLTVASCATGSGAALIAKTGAQANDRWHTHYVEVAGRLAPSNDAANAGQVGVGLSLSNRNVNNCVFGFVTSQKIGSRYQLAYGIQVYSGGSVSASQLSLTMLFNADDPQGKIPLSVGLLVTDGGNSAGTHNASLVVNGKVVLGQFATGFVAGNSTLYPFLEFQVPASGSATCYLTNLCQFTRFSTDGPSTAAVFGNGTISAATNSLGYGVDPGPSFLDAWTRFATREGWYLRYTPQAYAVGTRTLGLVDMAPDPGTDRSASVTFDRSRGNLVDLGLDENMDTFTGGTTGTGQSTPDGGGEAYWRDIATMQNIGVFEDIILIATPADFNSLLHATRNVMANKVLTGISGSKTAVVLRDADTADVWRELDKETINDPEMGANMLITRILGYDFTEGQLKQAQTLDQFSWAEDTRFA